jgi:hypothetical protein
VELAVATSVCAIGEDETLISDFQTDKKSVPSPVYSDPSVRMSSVYPGVDVCKEDEFIYRGNGAMRACL